MLNLFGGMFSNNGVSFIADFFDFFYKILGRRVVNLLKTIFTWIINLITKYIWMICKWVLGVIDVLQILFMKLIGIDTSALDSTSSLGEYIESLKNVRAPGGNNYYDYILKIFRALVAVAIILMIVFTIYSMVMQEYKIVANGGKGDNKKDKFFRIIFKNVIVIVLMPLIFYSLIIGTNSILLSFSKALDTSGYSTVAGNVLSAASYDANRYRAYANAGKRIPITITVYQTENIFGGTRGDEELKKELQTTDVQTKLKVIAGAFAEDSFLSFKESTLYNNDTWTSYANYSLVYNNKEYENMGQYFENFLCTQEQYYVMADFVDFCELYDVNYYIKEISEPDICWKYVEGVDLGIVSSDSEIDDQGNSIGDITLNITYTDAEAINNPTGYTGTETKYSLKLSTKLDMTSPISDALTTASKLLGIDEDSSKYNVMERDDSGDFDNLVNWSTRKAHLQLKGTTGNNFSLTQFDTWSFSDQIIIYEYYRFMNDFASTNNTLQKYTIDELKETGAYLDVLEMTYRNFNSNTKTYSDAETLYCVKINNSYYRVQESEDEFDDYGHAYFKLYVDDTDTPYFQNTNVTIVKSGTQKIKLSSRFDINDRESWTYMDQVLVYEYFKDLSLSNGLVRTYQFEDFEEGEDFDVYKITINNTETEYVYINGTFYAKSALGQGKNTDYVYGEDNALLKDTSVASESKFTYQLSNDISNLKEKYGLDLNDLILLGERTPTNYSEVDSNDVYYQKYTEMDFKLSDNFNFYNSDTWTYRDYALVYFYCKTDADEKKVTLDTLRMSMLGGKIAKDTEDGIYYLKIESDIGDNSTDKYYYYIKLEKLANISELPITSTISTTLFEDLSLDTSGIGLVVSYNSDNDLLLSGDTVVDSKTFYMSENFSRYDAATWTCGDYLMMYLIEKEIINTDLGLIQDKGYTALVYQANDKNYYRFGKDDGSNSCNALFLSENKLADKGYTPSKWFNTNLMSYMMSVYNITGSIRVEEEDFAGGALDNSSSFVYKKTTNYKDGSSLQYALGRDLVNNEGVLKDSSLFNYKYSNPTLIANDPTTWCFIDLVIYLATGSLPTQENPYQTQIVNSGSNWYMYVKNYAINISGDDTTKVKLDGDPLTTRIFSKYAGYSEASTYFSGNLSGMEMSDTNDNWALFNSGKTNAGKVYYYYDSSTTTAFDAILEVCGVKPAASGYEVFKACMFGGALYVEVKVDSRYFKLSTDSNSKIYYCENYLSQDVGENKAFAASGGGYSLNGTTYTRDANGKFKYTNAGTGSVYYLELDDLSDKYIKAYENTAIFKGIDFSATIGQETINKWTVASLIAGYVDPNKEYLTKYIDETSNSNNKVGVYLVYYNGDAYAHFKNSYSDYYVPVSYLNETFSSNFDSYFNDSRSDLVNGSELKNVVEANFTANERNHYYFYKYTLGELKDWRGNDIVVYYGPFNSDKTIKAGSVQRYVYGPKNESAEEISYTSGVTENSTTTTTNSLDPNVITFEITTQSMDNVSEWTMLDFIFSYATGTTLKGYALSYYYHYNSTQYIKYSDYYIQLPESVVTLVHDEDNEKYSIQSKENTGLMYKIKSEDVVMTRNANLRSFYTSKKSASNTMKREEGGKANREKQLQLIRFSDTFDASDYSTWSLSDYILYYNTADGGGYTSSVGFSINFEFQYTPNFYYVRSETDTNEVIFHNLTKLDLILDHCRWRKTNDLTNVSTLGLYLRGSGNVYNFNTLPYTEPITFYIGFIDKVSYLIYNAGGNNLAIPLDSQYISIDFNSRTITSPLLGETVSHNKSDKDKSNLYTKYTTDSFYTTLAGEYKDFNINNNNNEYYSDDYNTKNFQTMVNSAGAPAYVYFLIKEDPDTGSVQAQKVIRFESESGNNAASAKSGDCYIYDKFFEFKASAFSNYMQTYKETELTIDITSDSGKGTADEGKRIYFTNTYEGMHPDFVFDNYYYFTFEEGKEQELNNKILATEEERSVVMENKNNSSYIHAINLRLSQYDTPAVGPFIKNINFWTVLDYIIFREFARGDEVRHNKFKDMTYEELTNNDYTSGCLYEIDSKLYLLINNNVYNVTDYVEKDSSTGIYVNKKVKDIISDDIVLDERIQLKKVLGTDQLKLGTTSEHVFKVLKESWEISVVNAGKQYVKDKDNIIFNVGNTTTYIRYIDTNVADTNYRINTSRFGTYSTTKMIKQVSWVEKLMTDMQVYYPDLNWGVLIATDGWIDTLGDYVSANSTGLVTGGGGSANTTAAGIVLSEFFMSVATPVTFAYADYEYSSIFDEDTIKALMLSLCGEENYNALVLEAEVFMDYFNSCFAPIIDDFAQEFGESIGENSLRLSAYKSYLATLLLSSEIGEYLYKVATRVYAEYTICEYLAAAGGDYSGYYSYVNNLTDEDGNTVDSYTFGSFAQLVRYENEYCGNSTPTFTFNFKKAFEKYMNIDNKTINGYTYDMALTSLDNYESVCYTIVKKLESDYDGIYSKGGQISDSGKVVNVSGGLNSDETEHFYCYMLHVYYSIKYSLKSKSEPSYLKYFKEYIDGSISRWDIVSTQNIESADQYFEYYKSEEIKLTAYEITSSWYYVSLFDPDRVSTGNILDRLFEDFMLPFYVLDYINNDFDPNSKGAQELANYAYIPIKSAAEMCKGNASVSQDIIYISQNKVWDLIDSSENGGEDSWNKLNEFYNRVQNIVSELIDVQELVGNDATTNGGSKREGYSDDKIEQVTKAFQDLASNLEQYISAQTHIDQMKKRCVTFTLAQYGANYASTGYEFSVQNKDYTFKETTDPSRLAEYVYGGVFLEEVGVGAQYTSAEFEGMVHATKYYDPEDNVVKTNLVSWPELRSFASNLADKTAELYFMTNLKDLDVNTKNYVKLSDDNSAGGIVENVYINGNPYTNIEAALYSYIITCLENDELVKRVVNDEVGYTAYSHNKFIALARYVLSNSVDKEDFETMTLEDFKRAVIKQLIKNENNGDETPEERASRYLCLFNLLAVQVDFEYGSEQLGRTLRKCDYEKIKDAGETIKATFSVSSSTLETVKTLSGLENRPTREVLTRHYSGTRVADYYDEAFGDSFIVCYYYNGLYYPIVCSNEKGFADPNVKNEITDLKFVTKYACGTNIIAYKGVITPDGYPTAIRKYNNPIEIEQKRLFKTSTQTYNQVTYYRTNVGANFGEGDDLVNASKAVSKVTTKNYTRYVYGTSFTTGIGSTTTYTGRTNLRTIVKSDYSTFYVQSKVQYLTGQQDDYGAISVMDEFSYFYVFGGQSWVLLLLGFVTIIPIMINAVGGAAARMFDLLVLFLASPVVISTNSLYHEGENKIYTTWKQNLTSVLLGMLGYIIAFSAFTIMVPVVYNVNNFVSIDTYNKITAIAGIGSIFSYPTINSLVRSLWLITAISIIERVPKLLLPIMTANFGEIQSPDAGIGDSRTFIEKTKELGATVEQSVSKVGSVVSGKALLGLMSEIKEEAKNMIPGYDILKETKEKVLDPMRDRLQKVTGKLKEKALKTALQACGLDPATAQKASKAVMEAKQKAKEDKKKQKERMKQYRDEFKKNFM